MLARIFAAAGFELVAKRGSIDRRSIAARAGRILEQVIELAEALALPAKADQRLPAAGSQAGLMRIGVIGREASRGPRVARRRQTSARVRRRDLARRTAWTSRAEHAIIDVNIFIPAERAARRLERFRARLTFDEDAISQILRDGQTRVWWDDTPVDLFLNNLPIHDEVAEEVRWVPLRRIDIPVLSCESLVRFQGLFQPHKGLGGHRGVAEIEPAIIAAAAARARELVGPDEEITARLRALADQP